MVPGTVKEERGMKAEGVGAGGTWLGGAGGEVDGGGVKEVVEMCRYRRTDDEIRGAVTRRRRWCGVRGSMVQGEK